MNKLLKFYLPLFLSAILVIAGVGYWQYKKTEIVFASTLGPTICGTGANDTGTGTYSWATPTNGCTNSGSYTEAIITGGQSPCKNLTAKLIIGGSITGSNEATGSYYAGISPATYTMGSSSNMWGTTPTVAQVNASNFGVAYVATSLGGGGTSNYLDATNFGFSVPTGATLNGITVSMSQYYGGGNGNECYVNNLTMTITYTPGVTAPVQHGMTIQNSKVKILNAKVILKP